MERKAWQELTLEILDVSATMGGPNGVFPDKNGKGGNNGHAHDNES
ncbi:paeninodin family lasso peptide [Paenibacillus sp. GCM10023250]